MALFTALLFAINNQIKSGISKYHFKALIIQAPGALLATVLMSIGLSIFQRFSSTSKNALINHSNNTWLGWIWEIFYISVKSEGNDSKVIEYRLIKSRVVATIAICIIELLAIYIHFESLNYAVMASMNSGVLN